MKAYFYLGFTIFLMACTATKKGTGSANVAREFISYSTNGTQVRIFSGNNRVTTIGILFQGGMQNYSQKVQGIEFLSLKAALECGTLLQSFEEWKKRAAQLGILFSVISTYDYSGFQFSFPSSNFKYCWNHCLEPILRPSFRESEFFALKERLWNQAVETEVLPFERAKKWEVDSVWEGTTYSKIPEGDSQSMLNYSLQETKEYFSALKEKVGMMVLISGDVDTASLNERIQFGFEASQTQRLKRMESQGKMQPRKGCLLAEGRELARILIKAPHPTHIDFLRFDFASWILIQRLRQNFSGKIQHRIYPSQIPFVLFFFEGEKVSRLLRAMDLNANQLLSEGFSETEIAQYWNEWRYQKTRLLEDPLTLMVVLAEQVLGAGMYLQNFQNMKRPTAKEMNQTFSAYYKDLAITFAGDSTDLDPGFFIMGDRK